MSIRKLPKIMYKHIGAGIPDPCIKVRKGAINRLVGNFFDPTTALQVEIGTLVTDKKKIVRQARQQRSQKFEKVCLW